MAGDSSARIIDDSFNIRRNARRDSICISLFSRFKINDHATFQRRVTTTHRHGFLSLSVSCPGQEKNGRSARGNFSQVGVHERVNRPSWLEISGTARDSRAERKKADRSGKRKRTGSGYRGARGPTKFRAFAAFHAETFSDLSLL